MRTSQAILSPLPAGSIPPAASGPSAPTAALRREALLRGLPAELAWKLRSARELAAAAAPPLGARPTTVAALDSLLRGGLAPGTLTELVGRRSCGRFAAVAAVLAATTAGGEPAALVDLGDHLDPRHVEAAGADLERLLLARPRQLEEALAAAEHLLAGGFPLVVLDLGLPPVRRARGAHRVEAAWLRLARLAAAHRAALLVASPYRVSGTAAAAVVVLRGAQPRWRGPRRCPLLVAMGGAAMLEKRRGEVAGREEPLRLRVAEDVLGSEPPSPPPPAVGSPEPALAARLAMPPAAVDRDPARRRPSFGGATARPPRRSAAPETIAAAVGAAPFRTPPAPSSSAADAR
jgi:hypothetical protein